MLREYSLSLTFVAFLLIAYTAIVLYSRKSSDMSSLAHQAAVKATVEQAAPQTAESRPAE